ncbi:hypothetical protein ACFQ51_50155 [Streptomyces kaempferi]
MPPDTAPLSLARGLLQQADSDAVMVRVLAADGGEGTAHSYRDLLRTALALAADLTDLARTLGRPPGWDCSPRTPPNGWPPTSPPCSPAPSRSPYPPPSPPNRPPPSWRAPTCA